MSINVCLLFSSFHVP